MKLIIPFRDQIIFSQFFFIKLPYFTIHPKLFLNNVFLIIILQLCKSSRIVEITIYSYVTNKLEKQIYLVFQSTFIKKWYIKLWT